MPSITNFIDSAYSFGGTIGSTLNGVWLRTAGVRESIGTMIVKTATPYTTSLTSYSKKGLEYGSALLVSASDSYVGRTILIGLANMNARAVALFNPLLSRSPFLTRGLQAINTLNPIVATLVKAFLVITAAPYVVAAAFGVATAAYSLAARAVSLTARAFLNIPRKFFGELGLKRQQETDKRTALIHAGKRPREQRPLSRRQKAYIAVRIIPSVLGAVPGSALSSLKTFTANILKMPFQSIKYAALNGWYAAGDVLTTGPLSRVVAPWSFRTTRPGQTEARVGRLETDIEDFENETRAELEKIDRSLKGASAAIRGNLGFNDQIGAAVEAQTNDMSHMWRRVKALEAAVRRRGDEGLVVDNHPRPFDYSSDEEDDRLGGPIPGSFGGQPSRLRNNRE